MQETRIDVPVDRGVTLAVRRLRTPRADAPTLLMQHGLASSQHIWDLMLPRLIRRFWVVTFDARGHGESSKPASGYGFGRTVPDLVAVADAIGLRSPVVVGHSWGAMVALEAVVAHPQRFAGAVLVDGGLVPLGRSMDWPTARERLAPPHLAGMPLEEFRGMMRTFFADAVDATPDVEAIVLSVMRVDARGRIHPRLSRANHLRILHAIWEQDPIDLYRRLRVPVLGVLARMEDGTAEGRERLALKRAAEREARLAAGGRHARFTWIDGIHDLPLQHPAKLSGRIERFASSVVG
jgi:pimeloyl-ACP methyl ester carboxylesterase